MTRLGENMQRRRNANTFLVWREGKSVDWDCTAAELAEATGLSVQTVRSICRERGYRVRDGRRSADSVTLFGARGSVDVDDHEVRITESFLRGLEGSMLEGFEHVPDYDD